MKKSIKFYILEERKRKYKDRFFPNSVISVIGIFTEPIKAVKWIKNNQDWRRKPYPKDYFWALIKINSLNDIDSYLYKFYDNNGDPV